MKTARGWEKLATVKFSRRVAIAVKSFIDFVPLLALRPSLGCIRIIRSRRSLAAECTYVHTCAFSFVLQTSSRPLTHILLFASSFFDISPSLSLSLSLSLSPPFSLFLSLTRLPPRDPSSPPNWLVPLHDEGRGRRRQWKRKRWLKSRRKEGLRGEVDNYSLEEAGSPLCKVTRVLSSI